MLEQGLLSNKSLQGVQNGALQLTSDGVRSQRTYFKLPNLAAAEDGFEITFRFRLADADGGNPPADGFSFTYGPILLNEWAGEEGFGKGLSVEFDTWDNSTSGDPAENGYNVSVDGVDVVGGFVNADVPVDGQFHLARIAWMRSGIDSGLATLEVDGTRIFDAIATPSFSPHHTYTMAFAARTAGATEDMYLDDIVVRTPGDQADADGDQLRDVWEQTYFGNLDQTAGSDPDGDSLINSVEQTNNTNPNGDDTDADGLQDHVELLTTGTDPANPDTDGDGLADGAEVAGIPSLTDPKKFDSDGDGYGDNFEIAQHSDPLDAQSRPWRLPVPYYSALDATWRWRVDEVQIVWNHGAAVATSNDWLLGFAARNSSESGSNELEWNFRKQWDVLTYVFAAESNNLSNDGEGIWNSDWAFRDDKTRALGFSGTGNADTSQRLSFRCEFRESPTTGKWGGTFTIVNLDTETVVAEHGFSNLDAGPSIQNGTAEWTSRRGLVGSATVWSHAGIEIYIGGSPTTDLDSDRDGMSDVFETAHGLDAADPADAAGDIDGDGLTNVTEAQQGTDPTLIDSDGDGATDLQEINRGYSPIDATSSPLRQLTIEMPENPEDLSGNGISDVWEIAFQGLALAPFEDPDQDGATNLEESIAGTDPRSGDSRFSLRSQISGDDVLLRWPALRHKRYQVKSSSQLNSWETVETVDATGDGMVEMPLNSVLAGAEDRTFYKVDAGDIDSDADGLSDWAEAQLGTDIQDANSSGAPLRSETGDTLLTGDYLTFAESMSLNSDSQPEQNRPTRAQAARFLNQATFGATLEEIKRVQEMGFKGWIDAQIHDTEMYLHEPYIAELWQDHRYGLQEIPNYARGSFGLPGENATTPFIRAATQTEDHLRQRIAFALSQIIVVSLQDGNLDNRPQAMCNFYDILVRHAFGSYEDILREVSLHPVMGVYLSHIGNQKADPELNQFPDENYAREIKQLFTIGLWELNPNGTRILDASGEPIPTYGNREITEFARVFTGLWYAGRNWGNGGWDDEHFLKPMQMHPNRHDFGEKVLFEDRGLAGRGRIAIPQRAPSEANGIQDVSDAASVLFNHPNTPPFISQQLIQFLVTANPTPGFVERVQDVFVNDGSGQRGNLGAVAKAILLDPEARDPRIALSSPGFGKLKEPLLRAMALARACGLGRHKDLVWHRTSNFYDAAYQAPLSAPSVFNFYRPDYQAPGPIRDASLVSPVFQITNSYSSISYPNFLWDTITDGFEAQSWASKRQHFSLDFSPMLPMAGDAPALVDHVNLLFCNGSMTVATRRAIIAAINEIPATDSGLRAMLATYLAMMSPEGAVLR